MQKPKSKKKKFTIILACVLLLLTGGWWALSVHMYDKNVNKRIEPYEPLMFRLEDFEGLSRTKYEFPSDKGQMLTGYLYSAGEDQQAIIVLAHGFGGGGHNSYMDAIDYFAQHGFYVFAYDATGNGESEGAGVGGFSQGVIDLDHAISYVEENENFADLPICLFGHSWGGYCVCSVLNYHPEVKAVIECSGSNSSADLFEAGGKEQAGNIIYAMMPFVKLHERMKFGKYATDTAMDGFAASSAAVMAVHSTDDKTVPIEYGYDLYYKKYSDDQKFVFLKFEDRGHDDIFRDPGNSYRDEINAQFDSWLETVDYDYTADENLDRFAEDKADFIREHLDRKRWSSRLDEALFGQFVSFYEKNL